MPFGHHNHTTAQDGTTGAGYADDTANPNAVGPLGTGVGPAMEPAARDAVNTHHNHHMGAGTGAGAGAGAGTGTGTGTGAGLSSYDQGMTSMPPQNAAGGISNDPYANTVGNNDVAPTNHFSSGQQSGGGSSTTGKIERVIGKIVGSSSLQAKGLEKEREAQALHSQRTEITEAERLEQEAGLRRERAVQHGADPSNKAIGGAAQAQEFGGNFGSLGNSGTGAGAGNTAMPMARGGLM